MSTIKIAGGALSLAAMLLANTAFAETRPAQLNAPRAATATKAAAAPKVARRAQGVAGFASLDTTATAGLAGLGGLGIGLGTCFAAGCGKSDSPGH